MEKLKLKRKRNAISNIIWGYICRIVSIVLPFFFRSSMIKYMGAEYLGMNSLFISILNVLNMTELGFSSVIVVYMYKPVAERNNDELSRILNFYKKIYNIVGGFVLGGGIIVLPFLKLFINAEYPSNINIYVVYCLFLADTVVSYFMFAYRISLFSAYQRNDVTSRIMTITTVLRYAYAISVIVFTNNYYLYLISLPISTIIYNVICYKISIKYFPDIKLEGNVSNDFISLIRQDVFGLLCHKVAGTLTFSADTVIISKFLGLVVLAKYTNYSTIIDSLFMAIQTIFDATVAGIGNSYQTETVDKNNRDFNIMFFINYWITAWCCVCMLCLYQDFIEFWVGTDMLFGFFSVILLCLCFYLRMIRKTIHTYANALGLWKVNAAQPIVSTVFNIILNIILVKNIGLNGVIISTILSFVLIDIPWETIVVYRRITGMGSMTYVVKWFKYFIQFIFVAGITFEISNKIETGNLLINLFLKGTLCVIIPNVVIIFMNVRSSGIEYIKKILFNKWHMKKK